MENSSSRTLNQSFSLAEIIVYLIFDSLLNWITSLQKLLPTFSRNREITIKKNATPATAPKEEFIKKEDVEMVTERMGMSLSPRGEEMLKERTGFDELSAMFEEEQPTSEEVEAVFSVFDENRDGFIDAAELRRVLGELGFAEAAEFDACRSMIDAQDQDGDGRINFKEFVRFMEKGFCC